MAGTEEGVKKVKKGKKKTEDNKTEDKKTCRVLETLAVLLVVTLGTNVGLEHIKALLDNLVNIGEGVLKDLRAGIDLVFVNGVLKKQETPISSTTALPSTTFKQSALPHPPSSLPFPTPPPPPPLSSRGGLQSGEM